MTDRLAPDNVWKKPLNAPQAARPLGILSKQSGLPRHVSGFGDTDGSANYRDRSTGEVMQAPTETVAMGALSVADLPESQHFAQFYETDAFMLQAVSGFIGAGLAAGEAGIVVATRAHREGLEQRLQEYGLDTVAARASGQYLTLDAAETLSSFMVDGSPDHQRFTGRLGSILAEATRDGRRVRVFGEMVALLAAEGNHAAALHLEQLWNTLHESHAFTLFCAYPLDSFGGAALSNVLASVCAAHSHVVPAESYTELQAPNQRLQAIVELQQKARALEDEIAERKKVEARLRAVQATLELQLAEREQMLARERVAHAEAENLNRLKNEFLTTVSHELRTPLTTIILWSQMLSKGGRDQAAVARAAEIIDRNAQAQARLVDDMIDASFAMSGKLDLTIGLVDLASVIHAALDSIRGAAEAKNVAITLALDPTVPQLPADVNRLQQVVESLLINAVKFTPAGGRVVVETTRVGPQVQISVRDTGEGIAPEFLPFIFERFRQADGATTRKHGGLGLGLALTRDLVELHGGSISAHSQGIGCGATFTIRLPIIVGE